MALMPVAEALERILAGVMPLGPEHVGLRFSAGRTLAQDLSAALTHPPFDSSSMDGYALRAADAAKPKSSLRIIGEAAASGPLPEPSARAMRFEFLPERRSRAARIRLSFKKMCKWPAALSRSAAHRQAAITSARAARTSTKAITSCRADNASMPAISC